jgi:hypothetical protein
MSARDLIAATFWTLWRSDRVVSIRISIGWNHKRNNPKS